MRPKAARLRDPPPLDIFGSFPKLARTVETELGTAQPQLVLTSCHALLFLLFIIVKPDESALVGTVPPIFVSRVNLVGKVTPRIVSHYIQV